MSIYLVDVDQTEVFYWSTSTRMSTRLRFSTGRRSTSGWRFHHAHCFNKKKKSPKKEVFSLSFPKLCKFSMVVTYWQLYLGVKIKLWTSCNLERFYWKKNSAQSKKDGQLNKYYWLNHEEICILLKLLNVCQFGHNTWKGICGSFHLAEQFFVL